MSEIIPKDKQAEYKRWQFDSFDQPRPPIPQAVTARTPGKASEPTPQFNLPTAGDVERIYEEAHATGYQAGFDEGRLAAEQACQEATKAEVQRFLALTDNLQKALNELDQNVADQLLALATEIAGQVIRANISVKSDLLLPIIREAIAALPLHHTHLNLRLNPADASQVRSLLGEQLSQSGTQIIDDSEITPGGCFVRAGSSEVDATIETRWKRVLEAIGAEPQEWLNL